jgi:hypothetical protein
MQTLEFVVDNIIEKLGNFVTEKEQYALYNEEEFITDGLNFFQLHIASEIISYEAFITNREVQEDLKQWLEKTMDIDIKIDEVHLEDYKQLKKTLLLTDNYELNKFELSLYSKLCVYREFLSDVGLLGDFIEFTNELTIDLRNAIGPDKGLIDYLIENEIIVDDSDLEKE